MSYNKELETDKDAKRQHDANLKRAAAERLAKVAAKKKLLRNQKLSLMLLT